MERFNEIKIKVIQKRNRLLFKIKQYKYQLLIFAKRNRITIIFLIVLLLTISPCPSFHLPILNLRSNSKEILTTLIQSLSQILGIVAALVLIAFQVQRRTFGGKALEKFVRDGVLRDLFLFYILSIIYSFLGLITLYNPLTDINYRFLIFSSFLFLLCIAILYPSLLKIFDNLLAKKQVSDLLQNLHIGAIQQLSRAPRHALILSEFLKILEENPLYVIAEAVTAAIREKDNTSVRYVISDVSKKLVTLLESHPWERREIIMAFLFVYKQIIHEAIAERNTSILLLMVETFQEMHRYFAEKKFKWHEMIEFDEALEQLLSDSLEAGFDDVVSRGIYAVEFIMELHLQKNTPSADEFFEMDGGNIPTSKLPRDDHEKALQWKHISHDYISMLGTITENAIYSKRVSVISSRLRSFIWISGKTFELSNISEKMKGRIIGWAYYLAKDQSIRSIDQGLWRKMKVPSPFDEFQIRQFLDRKSELANKALMIYSEFIIELARKGELDRFELNEYGALGRGLMRDLNKDGIYREVLQYILSVFNEIRVILEKETTRDGKRVYHELHKQLESFVKWAEEHQKTIR
jgi:hypothetical protein